MAFAKGNKLGRKFTKGKSGNPGGKSLDDIEFEALCRAKSKGALETIERIATNPKHPKQFEAAKWLCEQGHGTARKRVEVSGPDGGAVPHRWIDVPAEPPKALTE